MKISRLFSLNKAQAELDFVDIDVKRDLALFIDPFFLNKRKANWSIKATLTIRSFFQTLIDCIRDNRIHEAKQLFRHLHEPNATCLGLSRGNPQGRDVGMEDTDRIFDSIIKSRAVQTGLIQDLEDNHLFVENFGKDKLSDMTINIIRKHLIDYTVSQCILNGIPVRENIPTGFYLNRHEREWESEYTTMLVIGDKKILLIPKGIVSFCSDYTPQQYGESAEWGHAIVAVGYDETKKIKNTNSNKETSGALLIRNSWGKEWGDKGYGWLPYEYILNNLALDF
jgi:hypothetical protein